MNVDLPHRYHCGARFIFIVGFFLCLLPSLTVAQRDDPSGVKLIESDYNAALSSLDARAKQTLNLAAFLNAVARDGFRTSGSTDEEKGLQYYRKGFRWNSDDEKGYSTWEPQGVSTWEDSLAQLGDDPADASYKNSMVVSWRDTSSSNNKGMRVTFVINGTATDSTSKRHSSILLVEDPSFSGNEIKFKHITPSESGGIVWHGSYLFVTDLKNGIRVFDTAHIWRLDNEVAPGISYILPQARIYTPSLPQKFLGFAFSSLSLDRNTTPPSLLTSSWITDPKTPTTLLKFPLNRDKQLLTSKVGDKFEVNANWAYRISIERVIGVVFSNGYYYISRIPAMQGTSRPDRTLKGGLFAWRPGYNVDEATGALPRAPGGVAYSQEQDELWVVGSRSGGRSIVAIKASNYIKNNNEQTVTLTTTRLPPTATPTDGIDPSATETSAGVETEAADEPPSASGSGKSKGKIIGPIVGTLLGVALITGIIIFSLRKRRSKKGTEDRSAEHGNFYAGGQQGSNSNSAVEGEIPMVKPELDANATEKFYPELETNPTRQEFAGGAGYNASPAEVWENERARAGRMPIRKPVPTTLPPYYESHRGSAHGPVELPSPI